jgi:carotenoid cleavage dioxygenase-like enzyme
MGKMSHYVRWKFDPNATDLHVEPTELVNIDGEMPKVDDRFATKKYNTLFLAVHDPTQETAPVGGMYNTLAICDLNTGKYNYWSAGEHAALHEVAFIPRSPEGMYSTSPVFSCIFTDCFSFQRLKATVS